MRRLVWEAKPYLPRFALATLLGVLAGLGPLSYIWGIRKIGDDLAGGNPSVAVLGVVVAAVLAVNFLANAASYGQNYLTAWSGQRLIADLRVRLFARVMHLPLGEFDKWRPGELLARFTNDLQLMTDAASISLPQLVQTSVTFIGAFAYMLYQDWLLTLFLVLFGPAVNYAVSFFTRLISTGSKRVQESVADVLANLSEVIHNQRVVKAFSRETHETHRFRDSNERYFSAYMKLTQFTQTQTPVIAMISTIAVLAVLVIAWREVLVGRMQRADMLAYATAIALTLNPLQRFASFIGDLSRGVVGAGRVFSVLDLPIEASDEAHALTPPSFLGPIRFDNVSFAYDSWSLPVLQDFSLELEGGEIAALVGPSGSGKTTIGNLIPRFFEPQSGRITIDGVDLRQIRLRTLRDAIGIVSQEPLLFSGTIADNIRYGKLDATHEEIKLAAREANAEEFIVALPDGYDTLLGESGIRLSGGQRQRIAIARAVLRNPRILILDEATSSLDTHSERLIEEALDELLSGRTTVIIAHRLSTIRRAHKIIYIDEGRIVEVGTHEDLLARRGAYAELHAAQFAQ